MTTQAADPRGDPRRGGRAPRSRRHGRAVDAPARRGARRRGDVALQPHPEQGRAARRHPRAHPAVARCRRRTRGPGRRSSRHQAHALHRALLAHPHAIPLFATRPAATPAAIERLDRYLEVLLSRRVQAARGAVDRPAGRAARRRPCDVDHRRARDGRRRRHAVAAARAARRARAREVESRIASSSSASTRCCTASRACWHERCRPPGRSAPKVTRGAPLAVQRPEPIVLSPRAERLRASAETSCGTCSF